MRGVPVSRSMLEASTRPRMHGGRAAGAGGSPTHRAVGNRGSGRTLDGAAAAVAYGNSWAIPGSETAPEPGKSPAASTVALKVGRMQKMLTSVEACPAPSVMLPAGAPVSVIVWAPPPAGPKAPGLRCWQSGHEPLPSVQVVGEPLPAKHC